jgi:hypothetical protein
MHIPIHRPIGTRYVAAVQGTVWKVVSCERCQERYAYRLELEATGESLDLLFLDRKGAAEEAHANAQKNLTQKSRNVVLLLPCPNGGFYRDNMSQQMKDDANINALQIAGALLALGSLIPLAFDIPEIWRLTLVLAIAGLALLACGYVRAF